MPKTSYLVKQRLDGRQKVRLDLVLQNLAPAPQLQALIETTVVALDADVPPLRVASLHQQSTHQEVLKRAVEATLRSHHGACNILTHGYGKAGRGRASGGERKDVASTLLQGPAWGMLLACIGDTLMLYLLIHSSIFMQMANGCYLQITGQPINKVVQERRAAVPGGVLSRPPTRRQTSSRKAAASLSTSTTPTPRIAAAYQDVLGSFRAASDDEAMLVQSGVDTGADILSILHKQRNARRTLYAHIFIQPLSMQREALKGRAQRPRPGQRAYRKLGLPAIPRRVPASQHRLEQRTLQMLGRARSHAQVTGFIWSVLRHVVPQALLGDKPVRKQLRTSLTAFIALRRHEVMSVGQAMQGLSLSSIPAFCPDGCRGPANAAAKQQRMLALWIRWLFAELIVPLLRAQFYVTESEAHRQRVFYYRKPVWAALTAKATSGLLQGMYRRISDNETRCTLQDRQLGITRLRFVPKPMGLRPISMLGCTSSATLPVPRDVGERWGNSQPRRVRLAFKPINTILQNLYQVLKYEVARQPEALGSTVFGYNDAYARLKPFLQRWRSSAAAHHSLSPPSEQRPYLLSVDVTRAFDSIDTELMLAVVAPVLQCHEYLIFRYLEVLPNNGKVRVAPRRAARALDAGAGRHSFLTHAHALAETYHGRIYMDQGAHQTLKRSAALQLLSAHMRQNIVRLGKDWCRQRQGIPQGSVLSTLLCSLYLGHLEKVYLQPILQGTLRPLAEGVPTLPAGQDTSHQPAQEQGSSSAGLTDLATAAVQTSRTPSEGAYLLGSESQPDGNAQQATLATQSAASLLLRLVDDFLLITFCPAAAEAMAACLLKGFPSHNIYTNPAKTQLSFELNHASMRLSRKVHISADGSEWVKWCGLLVNTASLDIQADYLRYSKKPLSDALTLPLSQSAGMQLEQKLRQHLRPKCHPILLDTSLHSAFTVRLNIFQGFLLAAMKFHCHHSSLSQVGSADVIWRAMEGGWKHMVHLIGRRMTSCTRRDSIGSACNVPHHQTTWLGMKAFQHVMVRKQALYSDVLKRLARQLQDPSFARLPRVCHEAVNMSKSADFMAILF
ncbi:hypothetical protein WJX84_002852 [Apatococcus fuscideae]|uniref:Telomerase reverse transcriptase n=1 Tax=Apatococcus fuscideae TaxID=2026836 RepID=A0AAW1SMT9_9CHLO